MGGLALNKKTQLYSHKRGEKTEESPFEAKERMSQSNRTEILTARYEIQNYKMPLESQAAGKVLPELIRTLAAGKSS